MTRSMLAAILLGMLIPMPLPAQAPAGDISSPAEPSAPAIDPDLSDPEPFDLEVAVQSYLAHLSPEEKARSDAYAEGGYWLQLWGFLWGLAVLGLLLGSGLSAKMRDLAERITRRRWLQSPLYGVQFVLVTTILSFPWTLYRDFFREHRYGLATQTFGPWLGDQLKGLVVAMVLLAGFLGVLYSVFRRAPRTWWLWGWGVALAFFVFGLVIAPVYVDPLFNTYEPLEDATIRDPILSLARANGVPAEDVYQYDASRQTTRISANVSGFLGTLSIRLNDNLLRRGTLPEIKAVMAHEIGHYVLNHNYQGIVFMGLLAFGGFAFVRWGFDRGLLKVGWRSRVRGLEDVAGFPWLALLFSVYLFALTPIFNSFIRTVETEADLFALNASREPDGFASMAMKLAEYRKVDPSPLEEWIFYDHPSGRSRVAMAMRWKAENLEVVSGATGTEPAVGSSALGDSEVPASTPAKPPP